ncbi:ZIP family metal transporter [Candidatus Woesearchaeota archaeon]|nr:ZIP family metal transporter [Candidatus Woesearchaeota archaeon]
MYIIFYALLSVFVVSLISLIGIFSLPLSNKSLEKILLYFVSFSAGALFGDAFIHLLPQAAAQGFTLKISLYALLGIVISFFIEKIIHWHHCHHTGKHYHEYNIHDNKSFAYMNIFGDLIHNFIDGLIIGGSYLVSIPVGLATTIAVILHEIPQEIGDFGVLLHAGFTKTRALVYNFLTSLSAFIGVAIALFIGLKSEAFFIFLLPFAAGSFIYIAGSDLIPELHKEKMFSKSTIQLLFFLFGIGIMILLLLLE